MIIIYTDGSALKNGRKDSEGGFGVVVCRGNSGEKPEDYTVIGAYSERYHGTTNNRMEMAAIIYALEHYGAMYNDFLAPLVYSDSMYCINTFTRWMKNWKANGWTRAQGEPIENLDLVKKYDQLSQSFKIELRHVKGHFGVIWNEVADELARGKITPAEVMERYGKENSH